MVYKYLSNKLKKKFLIGISLSQSLNSKNKINYFLKVEKYYISIKKNWKKDVFVLISFEHLLFF